MLSILMPVYNERERVERAIAEVLATELPVGVRADRRRRRLDRRDARDPARRRNGTAASGCSSIRRTGARAPPFRPRSRRPEANFAAIFDADLEYDPADLGLLMPPLLEGRTNASFGVRAFDGYTSHSFLFVLGNKGVTLACNILFNVYLHDIMTCHKMIRTDVFRDLPLSSAGFSIEPEITARLVQRGERIFEVPVHYRARATDEGKKLTAVDGFRVLGTLLRCRFSAA